MDISSPRQLSIGIVLSQITIGLITAVLFLYFAGAASAKSSLLGSLIAALTSLNFMSFSLFCRRSKRKILSFR